MSAYNHNHMIYNENKYMITALSNGEPFDVVKSGFSPKPSDGFTGYSYQLKISEGRLILDFLDVYDERGIYPELNGVSGEKETPHDMIFVEEDGSERVEHNFSSEHHREYNNVNQPLPYTGNILIGSGFLKVFFENMGFQKPYAFTELIELCFENGVLVKVIDRSRAARRVRHFIMSDDLMGRDPNMSSERYIYECFSLKYEDKAIWLKCFPEKKDEILYSLYDQAV